MCQTNTPSFHAKALAQRDAEPYSVVHFLY